MRGRPAQGVRARGRRLVFFWRVRRTAGLLLVPCLTWVAYAAALSGSVRLAEP
ncbi:tryptophan-rich sensory protein [Streptomyces sp. TRM 70351]|uniref:tryptophan-rich sensory protein n=1 Tax=Streptomyces sp. TRM 70351 TaxID=3116552 RepID=UPI002E7B5C59|nr:tryptophan-rich sensory protein [Streptomyces sp. TRM 70351]MEE1929610.1 tryptophan-rich sensory protein [Streptomyces sp. TRM 70351]